MTGRSGVKTLSLRRSDRFPSTRCGRYRKRDLVLVWKGASIHRSEAVKAFLRGGLAVSIWRLYQPIALR